MSELIKSNTNFEDQLFKNYLKLKIPERFNSIKKVDKAIQWYMADETNSIVSSVSDNNIILDIDIVSAFPTLANLLYKDNEFITKMNNAEDKRQRNIIMATSLKGQPLRFLNVLSKTIILTYIFDFYDYEEESSKIDIFELKKDGCLVSVSPLSVDRLFNYKSSDNEATKFLNKYFDLHVEKYDFYLRVNKTSYIMKDGELYLKGAFKYYPDFLHKYIKKIIYSEFTKDDEEFLLSIYNKKYLSILNQFKMNSLLRKYFICSNNKIINSQKNYDSIMKIENISPKMYLKIFLYPLLYIIRG